MERKPLSDALSNLGKAVKQLGQILQNKTDSEIIVRDATIKRFEICIELFWKTLKKCLAYEKIESTSPRDVFQKAFQNSLIDDEQEWLAIIDDRNMSVHIYQESLAEEIFERIKQHYLIMQTTYEKLAIHYKVPKQK